MSDPETRKGLRRLRILRILAGAHSPMSTAQLSARLDVSSRCVRDHLHFLVSLGCVARHNYRRWRLAAGWSLRSFNRARLDGGDDATPE